MQEREELSSDSRLKSFGLRATWIYVILILTVVPLGMHFQLIALAPLKLNELGDLLAGLFGPLAIFWLILGFLQQGDELRNSVLALRLQAEELKSSVEQQKNLVQVTERQLALDEEARRIEARRLLEIDLPYFLLETSGWSSSSGEGVSNRFKIKNRGTDAREVVVTVEDGTLVASPSNFQTIDAGGEAIFNVVSKFPIFEHELQTKIVINGFSKGDNVRNQTFMVGQKSVTLLEKKTIVVGKMMA